MARGQGEPAWDGGPYAWEELLALAGEGALSGREFIWYESSQKWVTVAEVPGLMPRAATDAAPEAAAEIPVEGEAEVLVEEATQVMPAAVPEVEEAPAAPAEQRASTGWYLSCAGVGSEGRIGPCAWNDLLALARDGAIHAGDFVWHESLTEWVPAEQLPELSSHLRPEAALDATVISAAPTQQSRPRSRRSLSPPRLSLPRWCLPQSRLPRAPAAVDMAAGWYMSRGEGASAWQGGPYSWAELVGYARDGRLADGDFVWHEAYGSWMSPAQVPGLKGV